MTVFLMSSAFLYAAGNTKSSWDSSDGVSLYGGTGISVGALPTTVSSDILDALSNLVVIVSTLRATAYGQLCFDVTDSLSIGASAGVYAITWVSDVITSYSIHYTKLYEYAVDANTSDHEI